MRNGNKLTATKIARLSKSGLYADGLGLYLQVAPGGSKSWIFRYMRDGKAKKMGLGSAKLVSLEEARGKAFILQRKLLDGVDPIEDRDTTKPRQSETTMVQKILRLPEVMAATGYSEQGIYKKIKNPNDDFPRPIKLGPRAIGWLENEIEAWQKALIEARNTAVNK